MKCRFDIFVESFLLETEARKVGIFCGAFKPPHKGHYEACAMASRECDEVHVIISNQARDMITPEISKRIWDEFARTLPNVVVAVAPASPVKSAYELIDALNKSPQAPNYAVYLYADKDDIPRFDRVNKFADKLAGTAIKETPRVCSARDVREAIQKQDWNTVLSYMPSQVDGNTILSILKTSIVS